MRQFLSISEKRIHFIILTIMLANTCGTLGQSVLISGTVKDHNQEPLPGVNIYLQGTNIGTISDIEGNFQITAVHSDTLVFRYMGMETETTTVGNREVIEIKMIPDFTKLNEVVIIGYGSESRRNLSVSVASVDEKEIKNISVPSFELALQGRLPGVIISNSNGSLGGNVLWRVRGVSSINANVQPLFIVDGIPISTGPGAQGINEGGFEGTNPLININLSDIASIDVLKDAASSAIYGSRGANGVVIITMKRGKSADKPKVDINYHIGFSEAANTYDVLTGKEYATLWNQAARNVGLDENSGLIYEVESQPNTDWQDLILQKGLIQQFNASVSGGNEQSTYFISGTYRNEEGYVKRTRLEKFAIRAALDQRISDKVGMGISIAPTRSVNSRQPGSLEIASPMTMAPIFFPNVPSKDENGNTIGGIVFTDIGISSFPGTPLANIEGIDLETITNQVLTNLDVNYNINDSWLFKSELGVDLIQVETTDRSGKNTTNGFAPNGLGQTFNSQVFNYIWTNTFNYNQRFDHHALKIDLGQSLQRSITTTSRVMAQDFPSDRLRTLDAAAQITGGGGTETEFSFLGYFLRGRYSFKDRIMATANVRVDGSSRFGDNNRFGAFPGFSLSWIISEESFFNLPWINYLKLRGSWGITGNAEISDFAARGLVEFGRNYNGAPGAEPLSLSNPDLTWEKNKQVDGGIDFVLFNNRLTGTIVYYNKRSNDLLLEAPIPTESGILPEGVFNASPFVTSNVGTVSNRGWEFELAAEVLRGRIQWISSFNISTLKNEVLSLIDTDGDGVDNDIETFGSIIRPGEPIGRLNSVRYAGVDPTNGDALFLDINGETTNVFSDNNRVLVGNPIPKLFGGFSNDFKYGSWDLSIFLQFSSGNDKFWNDGFLLNSMSGIFNQTRDMLNAWSPENPDTAVPQARLFTENGGQFTTRYLENAGYLRLKNLSLGYNIGLEKEYDLRIYLQAQNLVTFTDFKGLDPEGSFFSVNNAVNNGDFFGSPPARIFLIGFNLSF